MNKIDLTKVEAIDVTKNETIITPMPEPVVIPKGLRDQLGEPEAIWIYRMADGAAFGAVARWNPEGQRKQIRPIVWNGKAHVTSGFGDNRPLYNTEMLAAAPIAPVLIVEGLEKDFGGVRAAADGVVAYSGNELKGYGNLVLIRHEDGYVTAYAHASELFVKRGDTVKRGDVIAKAGQTGSVSSPQLHFEVRKGAVALDPMKFLSQNTASAN